MKCFIKSCICIGALLSIGILAAQTGEENTIVPQRDFLTELEQDLLAGPGASAFDFTVKKKLIWGRETNRVNIGYTGDGFAASDTNKFYQYSDSSIAYRRGLSSIPNNAMVMRPFARYEKFCNYYQVNLISLSSGIPGPLGGATSGRLGTVNGSATKNLFNDAAEVLGIEKIHWPVAILNNSGYNNSGGSIAVFSYPYWGDIACHEMGHCFHGLADNYYGSGTDTREYNEINSTATIGSEKWAHWVGYRDIDPRTRSGGGAPNTDTVGFLPGSRYVSIGQYRPTSNSKMNMTSQNNPVSYSVVAREKAILDIYDIVDPIDTMLSNSGTVTDPDSVWVQVIDPNVLKVDWYVDNTLKKPNGGTSIKKSEISAVPGSFTVKAHVYDECIRHMFSDNKNPDTLDIVRKDTTTLVQDVEWTVSLTDVAVLPTTMEKSVFSLSVNKNTIVYFLQQAGEAVFDLFGVNGSLVHRITTKGVAGRNSVELLQGKSGISAGMYFVKMSFGKRTQIVPVMIQ